MPLLPMVVPIVMMPASVVPKVTLPPAVWINASVVVKLPPVEIVKFCPM